MGPRARWGRRAGPGGRGGGAPGAGAAGLAQEERDDADGADLGRVVKRGPHARGAVLCVDGGAAALQRAADPGHVVVARRLEQLGLGRALPLPLAGEKLELSGRPNGGPIVLTAV